MHTLMLFNLHLFITSIHSISPQYLPITPEKKLSINKLQINTVENSTHQFNCVEKFVTTYMDRLPSRISVVLTDLSSVSDEYNAYLAQLQQIRSLFILTEDSIIQPKQNLSLNVLLIMKNYTDFETVTLKLNELCGRNCRYAVLLTNHFTDKQIFIDSAKKLVQLMWIKKVCNVVIIGTVKKSLIAAKSQAFKPNILREPKNPVIVGTCQNGSWTLKKNIFSQMKMNNSTIVIGYFEREPYSHRKKDATAIGFEVSLIKIIADAINVTLELLEIVVKKNSTRTDEIAIIFEKNNTNSIDLIIGGVIWRPSESIDFVIPYEVAKYIFMLPTEVKFSVGGLVSPLEKDVWIVIGCVFLFAMCLRFLLFKDISFLEILAIVIGTSWYKQPKKLSYRIKFMSWIIFGYILSQFYLASMAGKLMSRSVVKLNTYEDLVMSRTVVAGSEIAARTFKRVKGNSKEFDDLSKILLERYIVIEPKNVSRKVDDLISGANKSLAIMILTNATSSTPKYDPDILYILPEPLISCPLGFATWRNLPYISEFESKLMRLQQGGIVEYLGEKAAPRNQFEQKIDEEEEFVQNNFIDLDDLVPAFVCLIFAHFGSCLCLFCELITSWLIKSKKFQELRQKKINQLCRKRL